MAALEEMALFGGKLGELIKGKTSQEVVQLIGEPRLTTSNLNVGQSARSDHKIALYFFGFNGLEVSLTYRKNICIAVNRVQIEARRIEELAFQTTKAFALGKPRDEIAKFLQHDLTETKDLKSLVFRIGLSREWSFHFSGGKCDDVRDFVVL